MIPSLKRIGYLGLLTIGLIGLPAFSLAAESYSPTKYGGNFGLGLEFGDPGLWGATGKVWMDRQNAFQGAVKFGYNVATLQLDYLWHDFDLIHMRHKSGEIPFYVGVGGNLSLSNPVAVAGRVPVGISYIFDKQDVPVDVYLQGVPSLWFVGGTMTFFVFGELGAHYYF